MTRELRPFEEQLRSAKEDLKNMLASGRESAFIIAVMRLTIEMMEEDLRGWPRSVLAYNHMVDPEYGMSGPAHWYMARRRLASNRFMPTVRSREFYEAYVRKQEEYVLFGRRLVRDPQARVRAFRDPRRGISYLIRENPHVPRVMQIIERELTNWMNEQEIDESFLRRSVASGWWEFLQERTDIVALLRIIQQLPPDVEVIESGVSRPASVEAAELAIGLIPIVGSIVAAYEAYSGEDLFGYRLTSAERGILAATVLIPWAGRLAKGGRLLYSEARLVSLYGKDAASWSRVIQHGRQVSASNQALRTIKEAETALRTGGRLSGPLQQSALRAVREVVEGTPPAPVAVDQAVTDLFQALTSRYRVLNSLDVHALQRVLEKGPNVNHLKGQLLEELMESRVVPWLRDRAGSYALGIDTMGKKLEFIPGHLIRDASGRQITDGILVTRNNGVLDILAVFEAKAGRHAARELSLARGSMSSLTAAERAELRAYAKDVFREQRLAAEEAGRPFKRTLEQIEREIALSERGGQIRRDIERLSPNSDNTLPLIRIGSNMIPVRLSPTRTKFFGVIPRDVNRRLIERELAEAGFQFEIIGVDVTQSQLRGMAADMVPLATNMANASP